MKMTQKLVAMVAVAASALCASASTLYWQVSAPDDGATFDSATLYVQAAGSDSKTALGTVSEANGTLFSDGGGSYSDLMQADVSAYSGSDPAYNFFVEMVNYSADGGATRRGYTYSYQELADAGYIATDAFGVDTAAAAASSMNMGAPTPEPTSGMLLLIGGSLLALRRRRRQA
jgi:hypothetical protein